MSNTTEVTISKTFEGNYRPLSSSAYRHLLSFLRSPLLLCLLIAVVVRVWLIVHTNGVIAGDEAMVGLPVTRRVVLLKDALLFVVSIPVYVPIVQGSFS